MKTLKDISKLVYIQNNINKILIDSVENSIKNYLVNNLKNNKIEIKNFIKSINDESDETDKRIKNFFNNIFSELNIEIDNTSACCSIEDILYVFYDVLFKININDGFSFNFNLNLEYNKHNDTVDIIINGYFLLCSYYYDEIEFYKKIKL